MEIQPKQPSAKGSPDIFAGDVWIDPIALGDKPSRFKVSFVRFSPGARNAWHAHALGQTIHVTEGIGRTQARGGEMIEMHPGETVVTPPREWHWHGAAPDHFMTHIAMWETPDDGPETEWGDQISDAEYAGRD
jgi:quercetin dioxygenase-like cupin family protein